MSDKAQGFEDRIVEITDHVRDLLAAHDADVEVAVLVTLVTMWLQSFPERSQRRLMFKYFTEAVKKAVAVENKGHSASWREVAEGLEAI